MRRQSPEASLQRAVMQYLRLALPKHALAVHFPLGGGGLNHGRRMKALGAVAGFPDIIIFHNGRGFCLELKSVTGRVTPVQKNLHAALSAAGVEVAVCRSLDEVQALLPQWGLVTEWLVRRNAARAAA